MTRTLITILALGTLLAAFGSARPAEACSIFTAHDQDTVLVGDNEDWYSEEGASGYRPVIKFVPLPVQRLKWWCASAVAVTTRFEPAPTHWSGSSTLPCAPAEVSTQ